MPKSFLKLEHLEPMPLLYHQHAITQLSIASRFDRGRKVPTQMVYPSGHVGIGFPPGNLRAAFSENGAAAEAAEANARQANRQTENVAVVYASETDAKVVKPIVERYGFLLLLTAAIQVISCIVVLTDQNVHAFSPSTPQKCDTPLCRTLYSLLIASNLLPLLALVLKRPGLLATYSSATAVAFLLLLLHSFASVLDVIIIATVAACRVLSEHIVYYTSPHVFMVKR